MTEERASSALKGRLADVYVPALVEGSLDQLSRRLGNRATIDDPLFGRASTLSSIDPLLERFATHFKGATYRHVASATGVDRDVCEGVLVLDAVELPIAVVAERRRLREIELRLYYAPGDSGDARKTRAPLLTQNDDVPVPQIIAHVLEALRKGAVERVLAAFEEGSRWVDPSGKTHAKKDGSMAAFISDLRGRIELGVAGAADDGRTCCLETLLTRQGLTLQEPQPAAFSFERGDSGLLRELRLYYEA